MRKMLAILGSFIVLVVASTCASAQSWVTPTVGIGVSAPLVSSSETVTKPGINPILSLSSSRGGAPMLGWNGVKQTKVFKSPFYPECSVMSLNPVLVGIEPSAFIGQRIKVDATCVGKITISRDQLKNESYRANVSGGPNGCFSYVGKLDQTTETIVDGALLVDNKGTIHVNIQLMDFGPHYLVLDTISLGKKKQKDVLFFLHFVENRPTTTTAFFEFWVLDPSVALDQVAQGFCRKNFCESTPEWQGAIRDNVFDNYMSSSFFYITPHAPVAQQIDRLCRLGNNIPAPAGNDCLTQCKVSHCIRIQVGGRDYDGLVEVFDGRGQQTGRGPFLQFNDADQGMCVMYFRLKDIGSFQPKNIVIIPNGVTIVSL